MQPEIYDQKNPANTGERPGVREVWWAERFGGRRGLVRGEVWWEERFGERRGLVMKRFGEGACMGGFVATTNTKLSHVSTMI